MHRLGAEMRRAIYILFLVLCLAGCAVDHAAFMRNWRINPSIGQWVDDQGKVHEPGEPRPPQVDGARQS